MGKEGTDQPSPLPSKQEKEQSMLALSCTAETRSAQSPAEEALIGSTDEHRKATLIGVIDGHC